MTLKIASTDNSENIQRQKKESIISLEKNLIPYVLVIDIISTFQGLYEIINDRKHKNLILIPLSGSWGPRPPFQ